MRGESRCAEHTLCVASPLYKGWGRRRLRASLYSQRTKKKQEGRYHKEARLCRISNYGCFFTKKADSEYSAWAVTRVKSVRILICFHTYPVYTLLPFSSETFLTTASRVHRRFAFSCHPTDLRIPHRANAIKIIGSFHPIVNHTGRRTCTCVQLSRARCQPAPNSPAVFEPFANRTRALLVAAYSVSKCGPALYGCAWATYRAGRRLQAG